MWKVPADHEIFEELNPAQWLWYFYNFAKDQEEQHIMYRDFVEYHASFIEPQAVHKIRESRKKVVEVDDGSFARGVESVFGRPLPGKQNGIESSSSHNVDMNEILKNIDALKNNKKDSTFNYRYWTQLDLE